MRSVRSSVRSLSRATIQSIKRGTAKGYNILFYALEEQLKLAILYYIIYGYKELLFTNILTDNDYYNIYHSKYQPYLNIKIGIKDFPYPKYNTLLTGGDDTSKCTLVNKLVNVIFDLYHKISN